MTIEVFYRLKNIKQGENLKEYVDKYIDGEFEVEHIYKVKEDFKLQSIPYYNEDLFGAGDVVTIKKGCLIASIYGKDYHMDELMNKAWWPKSDILDDFYENRDKYVEVVKDYIEENI